jgi:hypothetical protein
MKERAALVTVGAAIGLAFAWAGMRAMGDMFAWVASVQGADPVLPVGAHRPGGGAAAGMSLTGRLWCAII